MIRLYELWKEYAFYVFEACCSFMKWADDLPVPVVFPMAAIVGASCVAYSFLSYWTFMSIWASIFLPFVWVMGKMFYVFFSHHDIHGHPRR